MTKMDTTYLIQVRTGGRWAYLTRPEPAPDGGAPLSLFVEFSTFGEAEAYLLENYDTRPKPLRIVQRVTLVTVLTTLGDG